MKRLENPIYQTTSVCGIGTVAQYDVNGVRTGQIRRHKRLGLHNLIQFEGTDVIAISRQVEIQNPVPVFHAREGHRTFEQPIRGVVMFIPHFVQGVHHRISMARKLVSPVT